jgi:hypothetical protein
MTDDLKDRLLAVIGSYRDSQTILYAVVSVAATVIYHAADDHGRALASVERQFVDELHAEITRLPHDAAYHDDLTN